MSVWACVTDRHTDRRIYKDMGVCMHVRMHAGTHVCKYTNIEVRS